MGNQRQTVEYRGKPKKECSKCGHHGRDVKERPKFPKLKMVCNNCVGKSFSR